MTRLFGNVTYVGIDTDPIYLYPKGAARVSFESRNSVVMAVKKRFLMPRETKTRKMVRFSRSSIGILNYPFFDEIR